MKLLSPTLTIGSGASRFTFRCLIRKGMHAVYEQWQFGRIVAYETFRVMSHEDYYIGETLIPAAESVPSSSVWGIHGFTLPTKEAAIKKMVSMMMKGNV